MWKPSREEILKALQSFDEEEAQMDRNLANLKETATPGVYRDVERQYNRARKAIAKRRPMLQAMLGDDKEPPLTTS